MVVWLTAAQVQAEWPDAPLSAERVDRLIKSAQEQCEAFAPALPADVDLEDVPERYRTALLLQVQALGSAVDRNGSDVVGFGDGFALRARGLSAEVKSLLRPKTPPSTA